MSFDVFRKALWKLVRLMDHFIVPGGD